MKRVQTNIFALALFDEVDHSGRGKKIYQRKENITIRQSFKRTCWRIVNAMAHLSHSFWKMVLAMTESPSPEYACKPFVGSLSFFFSRICFFCWLFRKSLRFRSVWTVSDCSDLDVSIIFVIVPKGSSSMKFGELMNINPHPYQVLCLMWKSWQFRRKSM